MRTPDSLSIPITFASTPSGVWMMSLTRTSKCFRSASDVSISFFLPLPFLPPFFGMLERFCLPRAAVLSRSGGELLCLRCCGSTRTASKPLHPGGYGGTLRPIHYCRFFQKGAVVLSACSMPFRPGR